MEYGLIGGKLGHSYSKTIHELLCGYSYELCPLPTEADARAFLQRRQFKAINVTIPYKKLHHRKECKSRFSTYWYYD